MLIEQFLRLRNIWLNLLFIGYLIFWQPSILQRLSMAEGRGQPDWLLGGILMILPIVELVGLLLKRPVSTYYAHRYPNREGGSCAVGLFIFTLIFHLCLSALLVLVAFSLLGIGLDDGTAPALQCLLLAVFFLVLFKEAFFTVLVFPTGAPTISGQGLEPPKSELDAMLRRWLSSHLPQQITLAVALRDLLGDLLLLAYSALVYTTLWEYAITSGEVRLEHDSAPAYLGATIYFLVVFLSTHSIYLMQELAIRQNRATKVFSGASFAVVWLTAMITLSGRH